MQTIPDKPADFSSDNGSGQPTHLYSRKLDKWIPTPKGYKVRPEGWKTHIWYKTEDGYEWIETPTIEDLEEWQSDCVCETPEGEMVEPDHPKSWMSVLRLI